MPVDCGTFHTRKVVIGQEIVTMIRLPSAEIRFQHSATPPLITICWKRNRAELRSPRCFGIVNTVIPMTLAEQLQGYQNEWVFIEYTELDEHLNAIQGRVIAHSPNKDEIYRILSQTHGKNVIVEYVGELPKDLAVMLSIS